MLVSLPYTCMLITGYASTQRDPTPHVKTVCRECKDVGEHDGAALFMYPKPTNGAVESVHRACGWRGK